MSRLVAPDDGFRGLAVERPNGKKVNIDADKHGVFNINNKALAKKLKEEGFVEASSFGVVGRSVGFTCSKCGFGSFFKKCSKCGTMNGENSE